jgi:glutamate synthase (NADPH/NADH) small chain
MDSVPKPGGRLMNGLPGFRLDKRVVGYRVEILKQRGVRFQMEVDWAATVTLAELQHGYDAIFIGFGRSEPVQLAIPGAALPGVHQAYPFVLQKTADVTLAAPPSVDVADKRVLVLGGGDTAIDAVRVALRCGAREAACVYRRDEASMPCNPKHYRDAVEEGAVFHFLRQPVAVLAGKAGHVTGLRCARTKLAGEDASVRGAPVVVSGSQYELPADEIFVAHGFAPPVLPPGGLFAPLATDQRGCLVVDAHHMTNLPGIFAGGAIVRGACTLPEVVGDARNAAAEINLYLMTQWRI